MSIVTENFEQINIFVSYVAGLQACLKEEFTMSVIIILLFIQNIETHKLNHTELEPRYVGQDGHAPRYVCNKENL